MNTTTLYRGKRNYELSNHLGNVNVVISDKRKSFCDEELGVERFEADVLSGVDYYPFGKTLPDRQYYASNDTSQFINGFNGMRYDHEINQKGRSIDYGARILDVDLERWLSVDAMWKANVHITPFAFSYICPLKIKDADGNIGRDSEGNIIFLPDGKPRFVMIGAYVESETVPDDGTKIINEVGYGYLAQMGYVLADDGSRIQVQKVISSETYLVTQRSGFKANGIPFKDTPVPKGDPINTLNSCSNCTGEAFLDGMFVLNSYFVSPEFLKSENYKELPINEKTQGGDIGLYFLQTKVHHAEVYRTGGKVDSKGGVEQMNLAQQPKKNWPYEFDNYIVYRKEGEDRKVSQADNKGEVGDGLRTVNKREMRQNQKTMRKESNAKTSGNEEK